MSDKSAEQQARDLLERYGLDDAQSLSAADVVELANLIEDAHAYRRGLSPARTSLLYLL
jgi:endonuclease III